MRKLLVTLDIDDYAPEITALTFPLMKHYARKIGAEFYVIRTRKYPDWPVAVEKLQLYDLARNYGAEWSLFFDADALINPEMPDWTSYLPRDTVAHNGSDFAGIRWRTNPYFLRDGRNIGSCNWCAIASDWCLDFWHPPDDLDPVRVLDEIYPTVEELNTGLIDPAHLVDDYLMSRNVARYGLKFTTLIALEKQLGLDGSFFLFHLYTVSPAEKVQQMKTLLFGPRTRADGVVDKGWNIPPSLMTP